MRGCHDLAYLDATRLSLDQVQVRLQLDGPRLPERNKDNSEPHWADSKQDEESLLMQKRGRRKFASVPAPEKGQLADIGLVRLTTRTSRRERPLLQLKAALRTHKKHRTFCIANRSALSERFAQGNLIQFNSLDFTCERLAWSQTLYPTELRARSVSPSTIPRCDAKLQLCSPDFVAHVAQLKPGSEMSAMGISKRVPPSPPILQSVLQQMFSNISPIQTYS